jgi:hypothetical protein
MNSLTHLRLSEVAQGFSSFTGVSRARQLLAKLIEWSAAESPKGIVIIDFEDVPVASASFLRESILAFRDYVRQYQPDVFPVIANVSDAVHEEFDILLRDRGEAMLGCSYENGEAVAPIILGDLDPALGSTLEIIREKGPVTLADLPDTTKASTWSNRLASLLKLGFIATSPEATKRAYRFVLGEGGLDGA